MKNAYKSLVAAGVGLYLLFAPADGEAFYVSQKEAQKAGIKTSEITKTKLPMGDKVSYKGHIEDSETFDDIAKRVHEWAEDFFGTRLSYRTTRKILSDFNYYRNIELPSMSVPCKYQFMMNYVEELQKEIEQCGKPGPAEKDLEFLKGKIQELEKLYEQDIVDLRGKYEQHDKRIGDLESRISAKEKHYDMKVEAEEREPEFAQPPVVERYQGSVSFIIGQPGWIPGLPYLYGFWGPSIYYLDGGYWRYWGWLEPFGHGFRARRHHDGRFFDYHGPSHWQHSYGRGFQGHGFRGAPRNFRAHPQQNFQGRNFCPPQNLGPHPGRSFREPQVIPRSGGSFRNFGNQGGRSFVPNPAPPQNRGMGRGYR